MLVAQRNEVHPITGEAADLLIFQRSDQQCYWYIIMLQNSCFQLSSGTKSFREAFANETDHFGSIKEALDHAKRVISDLRFYFEGREMSQYLNNILRSQIPATDFRDLIDEWQAENGAFTESEKSEARALLSK